MKQLLSIAFAALFLLSCQNEGKEIKKRLPVSASAINNITIVTSNKFWNGDVGEVIRKVFAEPVYGLPQEEPRFFLRQMEAKTFHTMVKKSRVFIQIEQNDSISGIKFITDLHATPQTGILIQGKTPTIINALLNNRATKMRNKITDIELAHKQDQIRKNPKKENPIKNVFGINLDVLFNYRVAKKTDDFIWLRKDIKNGDLNLMIYQLPYNTIKRDSLTIKNIVKLRDSIGKTHIPGATKGSYMITEQAFSPYLKSTTVANLPAIETRGIWDVKNDFMAGPFINYIINDKANNRQLVLEGFTYAPQINKRDYMFELEAIIKTLTIK